MPGILHHPTCKSSGLMISNLASRSDRDTFGVSVTRSSTISSYSLLVRVKVLEGCMPGSQALLVDPAASGASVAVPMLALA